MDKQDELAAVEYCSHCECPSCDARNRAASIRTTIAQDAEAKCWSCSCGYIFCYTRSEIEKYGEPSECGRCYRERLQECSTRAALAAIGGQDG